MEINITRLSRVNQYDLSHSRHEGGQNAGTNTWRAALNQAIKTSLLDTPEKLDAMREFALSSGGWDQEEITAWTSQELNALFLQWIAGDCRELGADAIEDIDWIAAEKIQQDGIASSNLFRSESGGIYFYLGN